MRDALRADLMLLAKSSWRRAQTERTARDDPVAKLAVEMDAPMEFAKRWEAMAFATHGGDHDEHSVVDGLTENKAGRMPSLLELLDFETDRSQTIWEREAQSCEVSAPEYKQACASCNYPLHPEWRCCPVCGKPV